MRFWEKRAIYKKLTKNVLTWLRRLTYETSLVRFVRRCNTLYYIAGSKGSENKENINDFRRYVSCAATPTELVRSKWLDFRKVNKTKK